MKNIIKTPGIIAIFLIFLFGCSEEFLDRPAQGNLDATTLSNQAGVEGNLIAAYSYLYVLEWHHILAAARFQSGWGRYSPPG